MENKQMENFNYKSKLNLKKCQSKSEFPLYPDF